MATAPRLSKKLRSLDAMAIQLVNVLWITMLSWRCVMGKGLQHSLCQMLPDALLNLIGLLIGLLLGLLVAKMVEVMRLIDPVPIALVALFCWFVLRIHDEDPEDSIVLIGYSVGFGINFDPSFCLPAAGLAILTFLTAPRP